MSFFPIGNSVQPKIIIQPQKSFDTKKKSQYGSIEENSILFDQDQFNQDQFGTSEIVVNESDDEENDDNNIIIAGDITEPTVNRNVITVDCTVHCWFRK